MNAKRVFYLKTLRYFSYLAVTAVLVYIAGNLFGFHSDRKVDHYTSSGKSEATGPQERHAVKPPSGKHREISGGEKAPDPKELLERIDSLPRTSLDLVLLEIINGEDGRSKAVIQDRATETDGIYPVGSTVRGAEVVLISGTRVILCVDGQDQVLEMTPQETEAQQDSSPEKESALSMAEPSWDDRSSLGYAQVKLKVRLKPYIRGGDQEGFEVKSVLKDSPLKAIGLEDGDIIEKINGEPIDSDLDILQIHDAINYSESYALSVLRGGKLITLSSKIK